MGDVARLPKQHRKYPHCATCGRELPALDDMVMTLGEHDATLARAVLQLTVQIECHCGAQWCLTKRCTDSAQPGKKGDDT